MFRRYYLWVMKMKADNLKELIDTSSSTRRFFLSLPVGTQLLLHARNEQIRTAEDLHRHVDFLQQTNFPDLFS